MPAIRERSATQAEIYLLVSARQAISTGSQLARHYMWCHDRLMGKVTEALELLRAKEASMTGQELKTLLESLGFEVRQGSNGGHHVVTHDGLEGFLSTSYDKSHNKQMLPCYPRSIKRVISQYRDQIEELLGENNGKA